MSESDAAAVVAGLAAAFPSMKLEEATVRVYVADLADLEIGYLAEAVRNVRRRMQFFPSIAEIRREYAELKLAAPGISRAFQEACGPSPRHPLVQEARKLVGDDWHWRTSETAALRRAFDKAYVEVRADALEAVVAPLELTR